MTSFVLLPGAGGAAWYWHRVVPLLQAAGHDVVALDLPADDEEQSLDEYAELVVEAMPARAPVVLVAHSLGGFTAPLVCARRPVAGLVLVNAMIPNPGETAGEWGDNTKSDQARKSAAKRGGYSAEFEEDTYFFHDVPAKLVRESAKHDRPESEVVFSTPCEFKAWPRIPTHVMIGKDDRLFPEAFQRRVARERLQCTIDVVEGGHLAHLSNPEGVADRLLVFAAELR